MEGWGGGAKLGGGGMHAKQQAPPPPQREGEEEEEKTPHSLAELTLCVLPVPAHQNNAPAVCL